VLVYFRFLFEMVACARFGENVMEFCSLSERQVLTEFIQVQMKVFSPRQFLLTLI